MPENNSPNPGHAEVRYERTDAQVGGIIMFGVMLAVLVLIVHVSVLLLFDRLKVREDRSYQPLPSFAAKERVHLPQDLDKIPSPRLQQSEFLDLAKLRQTERSLLNSYGWVDRKEGILHIPIDEAMRLLADPKMAAAIGIRVHSNEESKK